MTDSVKEPLLTLGDKQYAIDALNDQTKDLVQGLKVTDAQLRMTQDQLNVMKVARQAPWTNCRKLLRMCSLFLAYSPDFPGVVSEHLPDCGSRIQHKSPVKRQLPSGSLHGRGRLRL